jgi:hypothetical protein
LLLFAVYCECGRAIQLPVPVDPDGSAWIDCFTVKGELVLLERRAARIAGSVGLRPREIRATHSPRKLSSVFTRLFASRVAMRFASCPNSFLPLFHLRPFTVRTYRISLSDPPGSSAETKPYSETTSWVASGRAVRIPRGPLLTRVPAGCVCRSVSIPANRYALASKASASFARRATTVSV